MRASRTRPSCKSRTTVVGVEPMSPVNRRGAAAPRAGTFHRLAKAAIIVACAACRVTAAAQATEPEGRIRGVVRPITHSSISVDLPARVAHINVLEGERFSKGDIIIEFDCRRQRAELAAAAAQHHEMMLAVESQRYLERHRSAARLDLETSEAKAERTAAEVAVMEARIDQCRIVAPFDGRVAELSVRPMEMPSAAKPLLTIYEDRAFEIELLVPSTWLVWLSAGYPFTFRIDETQRSYSVIVHRLGAAVETVSQMVKVVARVENLDGSIIAGMSGTATFDKVAR